MVSSSNKLQQKLKNFHKIPEILYLICQRFVKHILQAMKVYIFWKVNTLLLGHFIIGSLVMFVIFQVLYRVNYAKPSISLK